MAYEHVTMEEYQQKRWALPADQIDLVAGYSPGYVSARLGVSRQAVHNAVKRDRLKAYRITENGKAWGKLQAIIITEQSIRDYENSDRRAKLRPEPIQKSA